MAYTLDDGLDEYVQQDNNPTVSVPQAAPQRKSAEQAETEKLLEVLKGISRAQSEMRSIMADLEDKAKKADRLSAAIRDDAKTIMSVWDKLFKGFNEDIKISDEGLEAFNKTMKQYADTILKDICIHLNKAISDNVAGQFTDVANSHIRDFDERMKTIEKSYKGVLKGYEDSINSLEEKQGKLLAHAVADKNRIIMSTGPFWTVMIVFVITVIGGLLGWFKFWQAGNDGALGWMLGATITEIVYAIMMAANYFGNSNERKKEETGVFSVSLAEAIYIILLILASVTYIVWFLLEVTGSAKLLIYLLPTAIASNFIWLMIRYIVNGVFRK